MKRRYQIGIGIIISLLLLGLFLHNTDFGELGKALKEANGAFIAPAILVYFIGVWFRALRWKYLLRPLADTRTNRLFPLITIGLMVNDVIPGRLGIVARAYIIGRKEGISKMASGATIIVENVCDGLALLLLLLIGLILIPTPGLVKTIALIAAAIFGTAFIVMIVITSSERQAQRAIRWLTLLAPQRWKQRVAYWTNLFISGLETLRSPRRFISIFLISLMVWLCESSVFYLVSLSLNLDLPFHAMMLVTAVTNLFWPLILIAPGGIGTFDAACKFTLTEALGSTAAVATAYTLVLHALLFLPVIILGFIFLWRENLSLTKITKREESVRPSKEARPE